MIKAINIDDRLFQELRDAVTFPESKQVDDGGGDDEDEDSAGIFIAKFVKKREERQKKIKSTMTSLALERGIEWIYIGQDKRLASDEIRLRAVQVDWKGTHKLGRDSLEIT